MNDSSAMYSRFSSRRLSFGQNQKVFYVPRPSHDVLLVFSPAWDEGRDVSHHCPCQGVSKRRGTSGTPFCLSTPTGAYVLFVAGRQWSLRYSPGFYSSLAAVHEAVQRSSRPETQIRPGYRHILYNLRLLPLLSERTRFRYIIFYSL